MTRKKQPAIRPSWAKVKIARHNISDGILDLQKWIASQTAQETSQK